ncbi:MAG: Trk system potassium transporter TrkA [Verrucomicrobiota bacterium]
MKIVICGIGEVGSHLARLLVENGHELVLVDPNPDSLSSIEETIDARIVIGSATSATTLKSIGIADTDIFLCLTSDDETNLVACSLAKALGAREVIARYHAPARQDHELFSYSDHFNIDYLVSPERLTAAHLAREIRSPISPVLDQFARGSIEVAQVELSENCPAVDFPLMDLKLPLRTRIGLIQRGSDVLIPSASEKLQANDQLILIGSPRPLAEAARQLVGEKKEKRFRLVVYGANDVTIALIENFNAFDVQIKVIEPDRARCEWISEHYPWVNVVEGHAIHSQLLIEENVMEADVFVAATRDDENNVMSCLQATKLGIRPSLLVIHRPDYAGILTDIGDILGINATVSPRIVTGTELLRYITTKPYVVLWEMNRGGAQIIRIRLKAESSDIFGKKVRDVVWPEHALLLGIERADGTLMPTADDTIEQNDALMVLVLPKSRESILKLFASAL